MALEEMEQAHGDRLRFAVDCDLKSFFDTVNHGLLMNRLLRKVHDKRVLRLISRYLNAGVILPDGKREPTPCGVPQGGPLSPLLANVMLDDLDKELERRELRFARYADDFLIFVRSRSAAQRVLRSVGQFIEGKLALIINRTKSKAASDGAWHIERYCQVSLTQPEGVLADGRKQYRPARPDKTMAMGSRCAEHAATLG